MRGIPVIPAVGLLALVTAVRPARAYDPQHTHRFLTRQAVALLVEKYPGDYDELLAYVDEVAAGAEEEDDPLLDGDSDPLTLRVMRHFFRPTDDLGLYMMDRRFPSSYEWAAQPNDVNEWDWDDGLAAWQAGDKARAYRTLGHVVHLIEDATVPAHTHLDVHGPPWGDDYEGFCSRQTTDEFTSTLPLPHPDARVPLFADRRDAWIRTATVSWYRNLYPGDLTDPEAGARGRLHEMFPDLAFHWFFQDWRGSLGVLGEDFFEHAPGEYYVKNAEVVAAVDKREGDVYVPNTTGAPMVELFARDLIPIAILHSAGVMKLYLDEAYALPVDPGAPPATGEDDAPTPAGCEVAAEKARPVPFWILLALVIPLCRRRN